MRTGIIKAGQCVTDPVKGMRCLNCPHTGSKKDSARVFLSGGIFTYMAACWRRSASMNKTTRLTV